MNCCFTDSLVTECENRRLAGLPMCPKHMRYTFRTALVDGLLPPDVFKVIAAEAIQELKLGMERREIDMDTWVAHARRKAATEKAAKKQLEGWVYYVQLTGGRVKIGWSRDVPTRLAAFRSRPDDLLATEPGGMDLEAKRHRQFAEDRIGRSEDFAHSAQIARHIERLKVNSHPRPVAT